MKIRKRGPVVEARCVRYDQGVCIAVRNELLNWVGGASSLGPNGGIYLHGHTGCFNGRKYVHPGSYLVKETNGNLTVVDSYTELKENYVIEC